MGIVPLGNATIRIMAAQECSMSPDALLLITLILILLAPLAAQLRLGLWAHRRGRRRFDHRPHALAVGPI